MCNGRWRVFVWKLPCGDPGFSLGQANSIYKAFSVYTIRSSIPLLSKIHILISGNFFFVFIPLHGSNCPPGTRVGEKKSHSTCKLDHLFFIQTDPFCIPTCRPNGDLSVVRDAPSRPPRHTTAFSVQLLECQGLYLGALLSRAVCFL